MALCVIISLEIVINGRDTIALYPENYWAIISRFVCSIVLHMQQQNKLRNGLQKMKFALNHSYKFKPSKGYVVSFMAGFMQSSMIMMVEVVNILSILQYDDTMNIVIIFLALAIIASFDEFFYDALGENKDKELVENEDGKYDEHLYSIRRTSSAAAWGDNELNKLDDPALNYLKSEKYANKKWKLDSLMEGDTQWICLRFKDRSCMNKVLMVFYRSYRTVYVSFWYYFFPFTVLLGTYYIPFSVNSFLGTSTTNIDPEMSGI